MAYATTEQLAWDTAMEYVDDGYNFACVPVIDRGSKAVWTAALDMPRPEDDMGVLAQVFVAINAARAEAERNGVHPLG